MATITFDQTGLSPAGITNRSRSDGLINGSEVTITVDQSGTVTFVDVPEGDVNSASSLIKTGTLAWKFTPTAGIYGSWLVEFQPAAPNTKPVRRVFAVRTPAKGLRIPAFNEHASSLATVADGASFVDQSDDNEGGTYRGWARALAELFRTVANGLFTANKVQESGGPATLNVSTIPASGVLRRNSTSQIVGGPVLVDNAGNITGAGTYNGVAVTAHAARHADGGADEISVTGLSGLLADPQTAGGLKTATTTVAISAAAAPTAGQVLAATSSTAAAWSTPAAVAPLAHKASHQDGGADEIVVTGLSGLLADPQTPTAHKTSHQLGGADVLSVAGLSGLLADPQTAGGLKSATTTVAISAAAAPAAGQVLTASSGSAATWATPAAGAAAHNTTHQDGGVDEISVAGLSGLLADPQTAGGLKTATTTVAISSSTAPTAGQVLAATSSTAAAWSTVSGAPLAHKASHQDGGADEISVTGLSGLLADPQTPLAHKVSHQDGGADEISVTGLSGLLADPQTAGGLKTATTTVAISAAAAPTAGQVLTASSGSAAAWTAPGAAAAHYATHQDGGADEINVTGLSGLLADPQTAGGLKTATTTVAISAAAAPTAGQVLAATSSTAAAWSTPAAVAPLAHKASHQDGGADEIIVTGLSGLLADPQTPLAHKTSHQQGGADVLSVTGLSGLLADPQTAGGLKTATTTVAVAAAAAPTAGQVLTASSGTVAAWAAPGAAAAHKTTHQDGGADEISVTGLSGLLADPQTAGGLKTATTTVAISSSTAPTAGQVLAATSSTAAAWGSTVGPLTVGPLTCDVLLQVPTNITWAANITLDAAVKNNYTIGALSGATTITWSNAAAGRQGTVAVRQNGAGNYTVTLTPPGGWTLMKDSVLSDYAAASAANAITIYTWSFITVGGASILFIGKILAV